MIKTINKQDKYGDFCISYNENHDLIKPDVSIIISAYNAKDDLKFSIESLMNQTYKNIEIIICNDGSIDNTEAICLELMENDSRIKVISQDNMGLTKSLNRMILLSRGKYIARQDSDDISSKDRIELQIKELSENDTYNFCVSRFHINGKVKPPAIYCCDLKRGYLRWGNYICHGTFFGKREVFEEIMYDDSCKFSQDYEFLLRGADVFKAKFLKQPLYSYSTSDKRISKSREKEQQRIASKINKKYFSIGSVNRRGYVKILRAINVVVLRVASRWLNI